MIFDRRVLRNTPARFRTRVIIEHIIPSLWIDYKSSTVKQYFKEGRALRTETTINNTRDCEIGRRIENLPALRAVAFNADRRTPAAGNNSIWAFVRTALRGVVKMIQPRSASCVR